MIRPAAVTRGWRDWTPLAVFALALTAAGFWSFPGRTILQSDTQIYIPILEHLWDSSVLSNDLVATRPHVGYTVYDETALALRWITGVSFERVLAGQQFVYRAVGVIGLILMATALGLSGWMAAVAASIVSLSVFVAGPAVIIVELEPVPRGFALPFLLLSLGLLGHGRWIPAGAAAGLCFLFHPPTGLVYCFLLAACAIRERRWRPAAIISGSVVLMAALAVAQNSASPDAPRMFERITPELEELMRMRASYNWISIWLPRWYQHYLLLAIVAFAAAVQLRRSAPPVLRFFLFALPAVGVLSLPLSYLLLERLKWSFVPQWQPGRYLLFVTLFALFGGAAAGIQAAQAGQHLRAFAFLSLALVIPMNSNIFNVLLRKSPSAGIQLAIAGGCAVFVILAARMAGRTAQAALALVAICLPLALIPSAGKVKNYPKLHEPELDSLAAWARTETPKQAMFQFAGFGQGLEPGVFRARALRPLYADWKSGGQLNFLREFAFLWWERWLKIRDLKTPDAFGALGIDYVVCRVRDMAPGRLPRYQNAKYVVYQVRP